MTRFHRLVLAGVAVASLATAGSASAEVLQARSECIDGYWHVRTYDISDGVERLVKDEPTEQRCGGAAAMNGGGMDRWPGANYQFQPKWDMRPSLGYQYSNPQPQRERPRIPMRYAF